MDPYQGASAPPAPANMAFTGPQPPHASPLAAAPLRKRNFFFRSPVFPSPAISSEMTPHGVHHVVPTPSKASTDETPLMWTMLFNIIVVVVLTALVELLGLPLVEFAVREPIDPKSRMGRLISALLAAVLFVSKVKGSLALICALVAGFYTTDILDTSLQEEFIPFFLIYFAVFYTIFEWILKLTQLGAELGHDHHAHAS